MRMKGAGARSGGALALALALSVASAQAQQTVVTLPAPATSANGDASGTISPGGSTFQKVFGGAGNSVAPTVGTSGARHGCSVQNNGTHSMYVTEGLGVSVSTLTNSWVVLSGGGLFNCNFAGIVLTGEIDISGTLGDAFVAKQF